MGYLYVRILFGIILTIGTLWVMRKRHLKKKVIYFFSVINFFVITSLSALVPVENIFINFVSPEEVFRYSVNGEIDKIIEGQNSALIIYKNKDISSIMVLPYTEKGWKIGTYFSYKEVFSKTVNNRIISVYNAKKTEDYYVIVWDPFGDSFIEVTDNLGSVFENVVGEEKNPNENVLYFTYVEGIGKEYAIVVDGEYVLIE